MAISVFRFGPRQQPPTPRRASRRGLSVASLSLLAAMGGVLLLQSLSITSRPAVSTSIAGAATEAVPTLEAAVLGEQMANQSGSIGAPLIETTTPSYQGYAAPALPTIEARSETAQQAQELQVTAVASSRLPDLPAIPPAPAGIPGCEDHGALYCVYEVKSGETLSTIVRTAGITASGDVSGVDLLVASNHAALNSANDVLMAGEKLRIPKQNGILHTVIAAETLSEIARRYGVKPEDITSLAGNKISDGDLLSAGAEILVPNPTKVGRTAAPSGTTGSRGGTGQLAWPVIGNITSYFGPAHPLGIDIALMPGDPVNAAGDGTVAFAGGDPCCSYGLFVIIDHGNGLHTLYGHLSVIYVDEGDKVDQGDRIGLGGYTGFGTGPHLHFEVHDDDMLEDPLTYLP